MTTKTKREALGRLSTEAIQRILDTLAGPELMPPSPEVPLGGLVQITGIGQVSVADLRAELKRREEA